MKDRDDVVRGWLRKAASDFASIDATMGAGSLDAACFHAQQAVEKYPKGFLAYHRQPFPNTHNLADLRELCAGIDAEFHSLTAAAAELTPCAVRLRYDDSFWPTSEMASRARALAHTIQQFVTSRLPEELRRPAV